MEKSDCPHNKIQVIRKGRSYVWSCALCGDEMVRWERKVWEYLQLDELEEGQGFIFNVVPLGSADGMEDCQA